ncbi:hypothetical protein Acsp04_22280 [Actinomadura sp. NBRC 104425]|uniref:dienelactone hydrolase family protein n=1 Tax=Actinomadura sp. NBRC 104425 TaxID=3032204 RepID=UPI0024A08D33|nr:hypothetical protein Acsp04_22280 [Actinomadura sp. NBRC 104425]
MTIKDIRLGRTPARVAGRASPPRGGVVALHQAPGYSAQTAAWLERLAAEGHLAVAPLLLHRQGVTAANPVERFGGDLAAFAELLPEDDDLRTDMAAVLDHFESAGITPSATGIVGFSYGGRASYLVAAERAMGAAASFYGCGVQRQSFEATTGCPRWTTHRGPAHAVARPLRRKGLHAGARRARRVGTGPSVGPRARPPGPLPRRRARLRRWTCRWAPDRPPPST